MTRRTAFVGIVFVLIALNVWRWWPSEKPARPLASKAVASSTADQLRLSLKVGGTAPAPVAFRDIFESRAYQAPAPGIVQPDVVPVAVSTPAPIDPLPPPAVVEPPPKTPEQLAEEAARAELAQIKVVGVLFRNARGQAYLSKGDQTYLVSLGDSVARFTVTSITAESVKLFDSRTRVGAEIPVLGK